MLADLWLAVRRLRAAPAFTAVAIATLALAIGANTAIFAVADAVLFRPLPYADPSRVHVIALRDARSGLLMPSIPAGYLDVISGHHRGLGPVGLRGPTTMTTHAGEGEAEWMETFGV